MKVGGSLTHWLYKIHHGMSAGSGSREMLGENDTPTSKCFSTYE